MTSRPRSLAPIQPEIRRHRPAAPAGSAAPPALFLSSTASVIEFGNLRGVSIRPSNGMRTMKKTK